jgi:hypothetical protein
MAELTCNVPTLKTQRELEQAVKQYKLGDFEGDELFCYWQAIREAALAQMPLEQEIHPIAGEDSY